MSNLAAFVALWLFVSSSVTAQIVSIDCTDTTVYSWTYNSLNQSPCRVGAYLASTCAGGTFTINALGTGQEYTGPSLLGGGDICKCNTVFYSLMSACGACQDKFWIDWPTWTTNCTTVSSPGTFPNAIPQGTRVPQWALLDVTREDLSLWDSIKAMNTGDTPEIGPGQLIGGSAAPSGPGATGSFSATVFNPTVDPGATTPGPTPSSPTTTPRSSPSQSSTTSKGSSSNTGAIVGGTVGGVAVIAIAAVVVFFMRRPRQQAPSTEYIVQSPQQQPAYGSQNPLSDDGTNVSSSVMVSEAPTVPMRLYDPNDRTTFPGYQAPSPGVPDSPSQPPYSPNSASSTTPMYPSYPQGYNGLPTV